MPLKDALPRFTVVIPTRERAETLRSSLQTVVRQDYEPLQILVSDNDSQDDTRDVVHSFRDPRITYINTGERLSMSRNWEFALRHVEGEFVTYIGDDDGLVPNALMDAATLLREYGVAALVWKKAQYQWPSHSMESIRNLLSVPLDNKLFLCDSSTVLRDCVRFWTPYYLLPCIYNSFVSVDAFRRVTARTGEFFGSVTPDVYSAFALGSVIDRYLWMTRSLSVNGASGRSNGANVDQFFRSESGQTETGRFLAEMDIPLHPQMPAVVVGSVVAAVLEAMLQANDRCFRGALPIDRADAFQRIMREVARQVPPRYEAAVSSLREIGDRTEMSDQAEAAIRKYPNDPVAPVPPPLGMALDDVLTVDISNFGAADVAAAAEVTASILGPYVRPATTRRYRHSAKYASRGLRLVRSRIDSWCWD